MRDLASQQLLSYDFKEHFAYRGRYVKDCFVHRCNISQKVISGVNVKSVQYHKQHAHFQHLEAYFKNCGKNFDINVPYSCFDLAFK